MSVLIEASTLITADGGVLDLINGKSLEVEAVAKNVGRAAVICFLIFVTFKGGFTVGKMILSMATAGLFLFLIGDVQSVADLFDNELNSAPSLVQPADLHSSAMAGGSDVHR